ncbi:MAG: prepilin-type N-terminal cleavage/methylation domain-containing protein [Patescibacteria group bacterium]|mgnify:FL=1
MNKEIKYYNKGISLLELIIYIAIFSVIILVMSEIFFASIKGGDLASVRFDVSQNMRFATEKIRQAVFDASAISVSGICPLNTLNVTSTINAATSSIFVESGILKISGVNGTESITSESVIATTTPADCLFTVILNPQPAKATLQAKLKMVYNSQGRSDLDVAESQQITVSLR